MDKKKKKLTFLACGLLRCIFNFYVRDIVRIIISMDVKYIADNGFCLHMTIE